MNRRPLSRRRLGGVALATVVLVGCGETYVDTSLLDDSTTSAPTSAPTLTSPPVSDGDDAVDRPAVIGRIDDALDRLSDAVADDAELAAELLATLERDWSLIEPGIRADHPNQLFGMQQAIDLARSAVTRKRPADASKAWKIVRDLAPVLS